MMKMIICISLTIALASHAAAKPREPSTQANHTEFSIEQLLNVEVYSTSKFAQKTPEVSDTLTTFTLADHGEHAYGKNSRPRKSLIY